MNNVSLMGNLVRDVEIRVTTSGTKVATCTIAVPRKFMKKGEEREVDFIDCVFWRKTAEFVGSYFKKGDKIAIDGSLQMRKWVDKEGRNRVNAEIQVENVYFTQPANKATKAKNEKYAEKQISVDDFDDDDSPF